MIQLLHRNNFWVFLSFITLFLYLLPLILYGENLYIRVHDHLDITVPTLKILAHSGMIFAPSMEIVPNMMGGLPRLVYGSEFNYLLWLFFFFKPFTAIVLNEIMIHCIAYLSMVVLLQHILRNEEIHFKLAVIHLTSLLFALTPFFPSTGLGVALLPLTFTLLLKIRLFQDTKKDWIILSFIPFFSSLILVYLFFLISVFALLLGEMIIKKQIHRRLIGAIWLMTIIFLLIDYRLVAEMFFGSDFVSHRTEFQRQCVDFAGFYRGVHNVFLFGQAHSLNLQFPYILIIIHLGFFLVLIKQRLSVMMSSFIIIMNAVLLSTDSLERMLMSKYYLPFAFGVTLLLWIRTKEHHVLYGSGFFILLSCLWYGFWYYEPWCHLSGQFSFLQTFDFSRFVLLLTPIWYVLLAYAWILIIQKIRFGWAIIIIIAAFQLNLTFASAQFFNNPTGVTYKKFYDEKLFNEIKTTIIDKPSTYRIASVGIPPAVALYNGLYTLDGYAPNYPLTYKHQFEALVCENFVHNPNSRLFIQNWGSKCYLIPGTYGVDEYYKNQVIEHFYINSELFYRMGGRYLLSGYKIINEEENHLTLIKTFEAKESYWKIYLYKVYS